MGELQNEAKLPVKFHWRRARGGTSEATVAAQGGGRRIGTEKELRCGKTNVIQCPASSSNSSKKTAAVRVFASESGNRKERLIEETP